MPPPFRQKALQILKKVLAVAGSIATVLVAIFTASPALFEKIANYLIARSEYYEDEQLEEAIAGVGGLLAEFDARHGSASMIARRENSYKYAIVWLNPAEKRLWEAHDLEINHVYFLAQKKDVLHDFEITKHGCASRPVSTGKILTSCKIITDDYIWAAVADTSLAVEMERNLEQIREQLLRVKRG